MHTPSPPTVIKLRKERFDARARELGLNSDTAIAEYIGVDRTLLGRIRRSAVLPGEKFIAACLQSKFAESFEQMFELGSAS